MGAGLGPPPSLLPFQPHSLSPSLSWGLRCLHPQRRKHDYPPGPAVLTPDTCLWVGSKDGAPCWLVRGHFVGGVSLAGAERRGPGSCGLGLTLLPVPHSGFSGRWRPASRLGVNFLKGLWLQTQGSLQHVSLDSALRFTGISSGNNDGCTP